MPKLNLSLEVDEALLHQLETLAQALEISQNQLLQKALEEFVARHELSDERKERVVNQGEIYWLQLNDGIPHPHLVLQEDVFNHSRLKTVIVCALTTNLKRASYPGNILLEPHEGQLPKQSVVEISKLSSVEKQQLGEFIGRLEDTRVQQILAALRFQQASFFKR